MEEKIKKAKKESFYISSRFMPKELKNSSFAPNDRWIITNAIDIVKTDNELRKTLKHASLFVAGGLTLLSAGIAGVVFTVSAMPFVAVALAISSLAGTTAFALLTKKKVDFIESNIVPRLKPEIAMRYAKLQAANIKEDMAKKIKDGFKDKKSKIFSFSLKDQMKKAQKALSKKTTPNQTNRNRNAPKPNN